MWKIKRGQIWFTDFVIAILIFSFMLVAFYTYTANISKQDSLMANDLILDAESISSSILLPGFPDPWDTSTVQGIGITNNNQKINSTKFLNFEKIPYNKTKRLFGTVYDYILFFTDSNGTLMSVEGICGIGSPKINITYNIRSAYYYDNNDDSLLKDFMMNTLDADIYSAQPGYGSFDDLMGKINNYSFVVIEHPLLSTAVFNNNKGKIESFVANKGLLMLSGEIVSAQGKDMLGVAFYKKSGQSISDRNSTVSAEDEFLAFTVGDNIVFSQAYYVKNQSGANNFTEIVKFNSDSNPAISRWTYGGGKAFYFSDFDVSYFIGNFIDEVTEAIKKWGNFKCNPINMNNTSYKNLVKIDRLLVYDSKPVKMVLYAWQ